MTGLRLRNILGGVLASALPLGAMGCTCPPVAENDYVSVPDGGFVLDAGGDADAERFPAGAGMLSVRECTVACRWDEKILIKDQPHQCRAIDRDGGLAVYCQDFIYPRCVGGRRTEGLARFAPAAATDLLGRFFARQAQLEAASVPAFSRLATELSAHKAPVRLERACGRARSDERRHVRVMQALARRHGATPLLPVLAPGAVRPLEAVATENAIEGCVRETYGALSAMWQAARAGDPVIRGAMARVGRDEVRHAALAWAIDGWLRGRLSQAARGRIEERRRQALGALRAEVDREIPASLAMRAGVPRRAESVALVDGIEEAINA